VGGVTKEVLRGNEVTLRGVNCVDLSWKKKVGDEDSNHVSEAPEEMTNRK